MDFLIEYYSDFLLNNQIPYSVGFFLWYAVEFLLTIFIMLFASVLFSLIERGVLSAFAGGKICYCREILNSFANSIKIFFKESIVSDKSDKILTFLIIVLYIIPCVLMWCVIPLGTTSLPVKSDIGLLLFIAAFVVSSLFKTGLEIAENNKYGLISAVRELIQTASFLVPFTVATLSIVILSGTMSLQNIVINQYNHGLFSWYCFPSFIGFCICITILLFYKKERTETKFSGIEYSVIKFGEQSKMIALCVFSATLFLGGYMPPVQFCAANFFEDFGLLYYMCLAAEQFIHIIIKSVIIYIFVLGIKSTIPTLKKNTCIEISWKYLVPLAVINILVVCLIKHGGFYG